MRKRRQIMTKVRINKKLVAIATTILMLVAMAMPVAAAPGNPEGSITVHKLSGRTMTGATPNLTGEALSPAELAALTAAGYTPLVGAEFTLYQLPQAQIDTINADITSTNGVVSHAITFVGGLPRVTFTMTNGNTHIATATAPYGTPQVTNASGQAVFGNNNIPDGYYVLVETDVPAGFREAAPTLIRLPLTRANGTFNYDVHVYPKNISLLDVAIKSVNDLERPVSNGDVLTFELKGRFSSPTVSSAAELRNDTTIPPTYGIAEIQENFANTFQYVTNTMTVHWLDGSGNITGVALPATFYTLTDTATGSPGGDLIVRLTQAGIDAAITAGAHGFGLRLNATYVGRPVAGVQPVVNKMQLLVVAPGETPPPPVETEIVLPTININVNKRTSEATGSAPLENVIFAVAKVAVPAINYTPGTPASAFTPAQLTSLANDYVVDATGVPITGTTDAAGQIIFSNIDGYNNAGVSFYLKELQTVPGYQLKPNTIEVKFLSRAEYQTLNPTWFTGNNWNEGVRVVESATVRNYLLEETDPDDPGFSLPLTGGAGTLAFTAIGILVMFGAALIYLRGKKRNV